MVWEGIHLNSITSLYVIHGSLTSLHYMDKIMRHPFIPSALQATRQGVTSQDNNATPHRARVITDFPQHQGIPRMDWPTRSPDFAPIQHVWDVLG